MLFYPSHANDLFLKPPLFSGGHRKRPVAWNGVTGTEIIGLNKYNSTPGDLPKKM